MVSRTPLSGTSRSAWNHFLVVHNGIAGDVAVEVARTQAVGKSAPLLMPAPARVEAGGARGGEGGLSGRLVDVGVRKDEVLGEELVLRAAGRAGVADVADQGVVIRLVGDLPVVVLGDDLGGAVERVDHQGGGVDRIVAQDAVGHRGVGRARQPGPVVAGVDVPGQVHVVHRLLHVQAGQVDGQLGARLQFDGRVSALVMPELEEEGAVDHLVRDPIAGGQSLDGPRRPATDQVRLVLLCSGPRRRRAGDIPARPVRPGGWPAVFSELCQENMALSVPSRFFLDRSL